MDEKPIENGTKTDRDPITGKFIEGNEGGPGRPHGSFSLKTLLEQEIQKQPRDQRITYALALIKKQLQQAINEGDQQTQKLIWNYLEGLPLQKTDMEIRGNLIIKIDQDIADKNNVASSKPKNNSEGQA